MPTYQYACTAEACGHEFEQFQSFSDNALTSCPVCQSRLRKVFGSIGVVFKGSGFYRNDSREKPKAAATSSSSDSTSSSDSAPAAKDTSAGGKDKSGAAKPAASNGKSPAKSSGESSNSKTPKAAATSAGKS